MEKEKLIVNGEEVIINVDKTDDIVRRILESSSGDVNEIIKTTFQNTPHLETTVEIKHDPNEAID